MVIIILNLIINFVADPFYDNKSQRTTIDDTPLNNPVFCNTQLSEAWYRFVTATYFLVALSILIIKVSGEEGELYFHFLRADIKSLQFK